MKTTKAYQNMTREDELLYVEAWMYGLNEDEIRTTTEEEVYQWLRYDSSWNEQDEALFSRFNKADFRALARDITWEIERQYPDDEYDD